VIEQSYITPADVNSARVVGQIETLAKIGGQLTGGVTRYTFSPEHLEATHQVAAWLTTAGLDVMFDEWGNLMGRTQPGDGLILSGSHLDSVPNGGNYDGVLGVLAALEAVTLIREKGIPVNKPLGVISFIEEEGARFKGLMGSSLATEKMSESEIAAIADATGQRFVDVLADCSFQYPMQPVSYRQGIDAFLELHIEQGKRLERTGIPVGVVTSIAGPTFMQVRLTGQADHAGATEYEDRHDSLLAAAEIIVAIRKMAVERFHDRGHMTVGKLDVQPNVTNVIAGQTVFNIDYRAADAAAYDDMSAEIASVLATVCDKHSVQYETGVMHTTPAVMTHPVIQQAFEQGAQQAGIDYQPLVSWAAHDAMNMAAVTDVGMLFVPCRDGRSHTPEEYVKLEDLGPGIAVLANAMIALAR